MTGPSFLDAGELLDRWRDEFLSGKPPVFFPVGEGQLGQIEVGPGLVSLFGGAPGSGKSALVMQLIVDALSLTPDLRALVCNVEMSPAALLERQIARLSGVDLTAIRYRRVGGEEIDRLNRGLHALEQIEGRLAFVRPPFNLDNVALAADSFGADLIALDYIQRVGPSGEPSDLRGAVGATMSHLRRFADGGAAIIVVAALARSKDSRGRSSYRGEDLSLASFRETSELEYGADDAFILAPAERGDGQGAMRRITLKHLKSRHGETRDIRLAFDPRLQSFSSTATPRARGVARSDELALTLRERWDRTSPADDDEEDV